MKKFATAIALTLCCLGLPGYADEVEHETVVNEAEVSIDVEPCTSGESVDAPQQSSDETDKGSN